MQKRLAKLMHVWYNSTDIDGRLPLYGGCYEIIFGTIEKRCMRH